VKSNKTYKSETILKIFYCSDFLQSRKNTFLLKNDFVANQPQRGNQLPISAARQQYWPQICFAIFI